MTRGYEISKSQERSSDRGTQTLFVGEFLSTHMYTDLKSELKSELKPQSLPPKIQDPRFPDFFLGCRLEILDAPKIQDPRFPACIQEKNSGNLGSWILGASKILQVHPRKVFWKSWILGLSQDFQEKLSGNLGSWILGSRNRDYDTQV